MVMRPPVGQLPMLMVVGCLLFAASMVQARPPHRSPPSKRADKAKTAGGIKLLGRHDRHKPAPAVMRVQTWSNPIYSRVALYLSAPAKARVGFLTRDGKSGTLPRIFVDIADATLAPSVQPEWPVDDALVSRVRLARRDLKTVRVVLDLKKEARPRLLIMENPYRLIVDAMVPKSVQHQSVASAAAHVGEAASDVPGLKSLGNVVKPPRPRVVLDPGHGGTDSGALGPHGCQEKNVVLAVALKTRALLEAAGIEAILTRSTDTFVSLEERTATANRLGAQAFISIHANSAPNKKARGIETYYLNVTSDRYAIRLAALENQTSIQQVSDLQLILADLTTKANSHESLSLARLVQKSMMSHIQPRNRFARDLGVKASLFYVLLGARMPSILVETSFVSNADEARLLMTSGYQQHIARAIAEACRSHLTQARWARAG